MTQIVICEKPSQARDIRAAIGSKYGEVLPALGHLMRLAEPEEVNPAWAVWSYDVLLPEGGRYPLREDQGRGKADKLSPLKTALGRAETIYVATDCDREGTLIGGELVGSFAAPHARILRVVFTAQDPTTLRAAFAKARPWSDFANELAAGEARANADQIYNLSLTRAATKALRSPGAKGAIGIGRVKTPTLAIVCRRELEIVNFKPEGYFEIAATAQVADGAFVMRHAPAGDRRIKDRAAAEAVARNAEGWQGPLTVTVEAKRQAPPRLFDLPALQKMASSRWGWGADRTLSVAQALYENHKAITYPRAESRYLSESLIPQAEKLMAVLAPIHGVTAAAPIIRTGRDGVFCDGALQGVSHHAIIPNANMAGNLAAILRALSADERNLFDVLSRAYLAALFPDHLFLQTNVSAAVAGAEFKAVGRITTSLGWKAVYDDGGESEADGDKKAEVAQILPRMNDGEAGRLSKSKVEAKTTKAPPRYTEGSLVGAMQDAWRFVPADRPELREKLKQTKGIGTPATRAEIIKGLFAQGFLVRKGKQVIPTEHGLGLYKILAEATPRLVEPAVTAIWETKLDLIAHGRLAADEVIRAIAGEAGHIIEILKGRCRPESLGRPELSGNAPSAAKVGFARKLAAEAGIQLPAEALSDWRKCSQFIDAHMGAEKKPRRKSAKATGGSARASGMAGKPPTEKQIALVRRLADEKGMVIPADALSDMARSSAFIGRMLGKGAVSRRSVAR